MGHDIRAHGYPPAPSGWGQHTQARTVGPEPLTLQAVGAEVISARFKFPGNKHLLAALTEEVGELAQAMLQGKPRDEIEREAIQVACLACRIIEEGDSAFADMTADEQKA